MGVSANQARLLSLTARKCDLEAQIQKVMNTKLSIARESAAIANDYSDAVSNRKLYIFSPTSDATQSQYQELSTKNLYNTGGLLIAKKVLGGGYEQVGNLSTTQIENGLRDGTLYMVKAADLTTQDPQTITFDNNYGDGSIFGGATSNNQWQIVDWRESTSISDELDTTDDETAQANYENSMKELNIKETKMDVEMNNIETEHSAVTNEIDSVKKIISQNTEQSFKYLS